MTISSKAARAAGLVWLAYASTGIAAPPGEPGLVGTWRLVRFEDTDAEGKVTKAFGEKPRGYLVYDSTGHVSIQITRDAPQKPFASGSDGTGTDAEVRQAYDGYVAYFGTYRVDPEKRLLTHVVEGSLRPSYTGTEQVRPYRLDGDTFVIAGDYPGGGKYYREMRRVRAAPAK